MSDSLKTVLQTDILRNESRADTISCRVIHHDEQHRLVVIESASAGETTPQSVAYTRLSPSTWPRTVADVNEALKDGALMGETFRAAGYTVRQNRLLEIKLPILSRTLASLYSSPRWRLTTIECYEFWVNDVLYGTVLEIKAPSRRHSPQRQWLGTYWLLRQTGVPETRFTQWLSQQQRTSLYEKILIFSAKVVGIIFSIWLYVSTVMRSKKRLNVVS